MGSLIHVSAWERVSPGRRVLCAFVRVAIWLTLLVILVEFFGPPIAIFTTARWEARRIPGVEVSPQPLTDYSVSDAPGTVMSYFGYSFEVPWSARFREKAFGKEGLAQVQFESGRAVTFIVPANQDGLFAEVVKDKSMHMKSLEIVLGDLMNRSAYDQYAALLKATPSTIRSFGPRAEAVRGMTLLTMKAIAIGPGLETGVFSFELPDKRGFQVGDPRKSRRADLEVFGMGGHHVEIICVTSGDSVRLSQPELNRILTSLHAVPMESSGSTHVQVTARGKKR